MHRYMLTPFIGSRRAS